MDGGRVHIRGSVGIVNGERVEGTTNGGRERTVSMDDSTVAVMREHCAAQEWERHVAGGSWVAGDHVFRMALGGTLFPDTVTALMAKRLRAYNEAASDDPAPPRDPPLQAGVPVHVVAARLGHADPTITLRVYAHVLQDQAREAADVFARLLRPGQGPPCQQIREQAPRPGTQNRRPSPERPAVLCGGQGRGRTADLPIFSRTLVPTELPGLGGASHASATGLTCGFIHGRPVAARPS